MMKQRLPCISQAGSHTHQVEDKVNDPKLTIAMMLKLRFINPFFNFKLNATQTWSRLATDVETEHQNLEVPKVNVGPTW